MEAHLLSQTFETKDLDVAFIYIYIVLLVYGKSRLESSGGKLVAVETKVGPS